MKRRKVVAVSERMVLEAEVKTHSALMAAADAEHVAEAVRGFVAAIEEGRAGATASAISSVDEEIKSLGFAVPKVARSVGASAFDRERGAEIGNSLGVRWLAEQSGGAMPGGSLADILEVVSATESFDAANRARIARIAEVNHPSLMMAISAYLDPAICLSCEATANEVAEPSQGFSQPIPRHPRCRCLCVAHKRTVNDKGIITSASEKVRRIQRSAA